ncbi:MAG: pyridoxamine 5'-phosphate oxidase family protein [Acidimicrobiia bacterium]
MPGYELLPAEEGRGLLPWSWAEARLTTARNYWVTTANAAGRGHTMPVWGVWLDDAFFFRTGRQTRKARNLAERPDCVICPERADEAASLARVADAYHAGYPMGFPEDEPVFRVEAGVVFGVVEAPDEFAGSRPVGGSRPFRITIRGSSTGRPHVPRRARERRHARFRSGECRACTEARDAARARD